MAIGLKADQPEPFPARCSIGIRNRVRGFTPVARRLQAAEAQARREVPANRIGAGAQKRGFEVLALACSLPGNQCCIDRGGRRHRGGMVAHAAALHRRFMTLGREHGGYASARPVGPDIVGGPIAVGTSRAIAGDGAVDQSRVSVGQCFVVQPETGQGAGPQIGNEDIRLLDQLPGDGAALFFLQIEDNGALAPVIELKSWIDRDIDAHGGREHCTHRIPGRGLDLDHRGAPIPQNTAGCGPGDPKPQFNDPNAFEWSSHSESVPGSGHKIKSRTPI